MTIQRYKVSEYAKLNRVTQRTVWRWISEEKVKVEKTHTGGVRIVVEITDKEQKVAVYARVSTTENKDNLERQKERLISYCNAKGYKVEQVVTEIASGLNDTRPKLEKILLDESINIIVVEHKDRLARFGLNYIEKLLEMQGRRIENINPQSNDIDDLMEDFVSIVTSFCSRLYGRRRTKRKTEQIIKELQKEDSE